MILTWQHKKVQLGFHYRWLLLQATAAVTLNVVSVVQQQTTTQYTTQTFPSVEKISINIQACFQIYYKTQYLQTVYKFLYCEQKLPWIEYGYNHKWVNEWLLFKAKWAIFQPYYSEYKLYFDEMMIMSTLSQINTPSCLWFNHTRS